MPRVYAREEHRRVSVCSYGVEHRLRPLVNSPFLVARIVHVGIGREACGRDLRSSMTCRDAGENLLKNLSTRMRRTRCLISRSRPGHFGSLETAVFGTVHHGDLHDEAEDFPTREGGLYYAGGCLSRGRENS